MPDVLVRNVPEDDLEQLRTAAAEQGVSLQNLLRDGLQAQAAYLRRQSALSRIGEQLSGRPVSEAERDAVLGAVDLAHHERAGQLSDRPIR